jgi:hypothetical protein
MLREATYPPAAVNVLDVSSESMAAFQVFMYGRFWVFTEAKPSFPILGSYCRQATPKVPRALALFQPCSDTHLRGERLCPRFPMQRLPRPALAQSGGAVHQMK